MVKIRINSNNVSFQRDMTSGALMTLKNAHAHPLGEQVVVGVEVAPAHPGVLQGHHGPVGQLARHAGVVQEVALQSRLEQRAEVAVAIAPGIKHIGSGFKSFLGV